MYVLIKRNILIISNNYIKSLGFFENMNTKKKIFLAGPLSNPWRRKVISLLKNIYEFYNPVTDSRQQSQAMYVPDDLKAIESCDIVLAYQPNEMPCLGMAVEATFGFNKEKIVIYVDERGSLDPLMIGISKRPFSKLDDAITFLKKFEQNPEGQGIFKN